MSVEPISEKSAQPQAGKPRSEIKFPGYDLASSVEVAQAIHAKGGGAAAPENLAAFLNYKGTNNGAYLTKVASARMFGLIAKQGNLYVPTPLAHRIITPVYQSDAAQALIDAFLNVELFKKVYEDFKGKELPPEFGMKNAMRTQYGVVPARIGDAYRNLIDSAETAGFFSTKMGARTHLIMPMIHVAQSASAPTKSASNESASDPAEFGGGGGGGGGGGKTTADPSNLADVKARYLSSLLTLFEAKSAKGELDEQLMERIERLLGASP